MNWVMLVIVSIVAVSIMTGSMVWGMTLERRYRGPYTLLATSPRQKWKRGAILAFWQTLMFPTLGWYFGLYLMKFSASWLFLPLAASGLWLLLLPLAVLIKRWGLQRELNRYRRVSELIRKGGSGESLFSSGLMRWTGRLLTPEEKRFFEEGYPQEADGV